MNELSLFTGAGGGVLSSKLLRWRTVGYVEIDDYCQRVLAQRIKDGFLDDAPIYGDIKAFISEGFAAAYENAVDVITAGFPCQPFSVAGKQLGEDDPRNMWPATLEAIRLVRPRYCLLENVPGLLAHRYFGRILGDLAESGYDARWKVISAAELGAPHKRDRLWIVADATGVRRNNSNKSIWKMSAKSKQHPYSWSDNLSEIYVQWNVEPNFNGMATELANRVDRLKAIGNGQVPAVVRAAWEALR